jgi:NTE family protein
MTSALVLSGGGANGAYEVGVLKAMAAGLCPSLRSEPLNLSAVTATSIGAFNAGVLLSHFDGNWQDAVTALESTWLDRIAPAGGAASGNGVFRYRPNVPEWFNVAQIARNPLQPARELMADARFLAQDWMARLAGFVSSTDALSHRFAELVDLSTFLTPEPSAELVQASVSPSKLRASPVALRVTATAWKTGTLRVFENADFTDAAGDAIIRASGAIPGIFPSVPINGDPYVDGGVVLNTPLKPAIDSGADVLHVIYLDPEPGALPLRPVGSTMDAMGRMFVSSFAATMRRDLQVAAAVNRAVANGSETKLRPIEIHLYHPLEDMGGTLGMLDFHRHHVSLLIDVGYKNAITHDCARAGCLNVG